MYGRQVADLFEHFPREQVLLLRYRELVDEPRPDPGPGLPLPRRRSRPRSTTIPKDNSRAFVQDGVAGPRRSAPVIRAGAAVGPVPPAARCGAGSASR